MDSPFSPQVIHTPRLTLQMVTPELLHQLFTTGSDDEVMHSLHLGSAEELALEKAKFSNGFTMHDVSFRRFLMVEQETGIFVGRCGFHTWRHSLFRAEIGYRMASKELMGRGYMTEALRAVVIHGFEEMGLRRAEAMTGPGNIASHRLLLRLGFTAEGTLREHYYHDGVPEDSVVFSLLKREYEALKETRAYGL